MKIANNELAALLSSQLTGASERERNLLQRVIDEIRDSKIDVSTESESSLKLKAIIDSHSEILSGEILETISAAELYCVDAPLCHAFARPDFERNQIIIFDGLLEAIKFYANLIKLIDLFNLSADSPQCQVEAEDLTTAAFALLIDFIETGRELPQIEEVLPAPHRQDAHLGYLASVIFLICHEAAHIRLGHLKASYHSERALAKVKIEEDLNEDKKLELEADEYAYTAIRKDLRDLFMASVISFFAPFSFAETFCSGQIVSHPLAVNRLSRLAELVVLDKDLEARNAVSEIIESEIKRYQQLAFYRQSFGKNGRRRIEQIMPPEEASLIIEELLEKCRTENYFAAFETGN